ncbi:MAG TPA: cytochrome P460 family protein [Acidobacteriota bacterium]|nr:cytochrome P460 family protein [Acidobacteriota bacterium]
MLSRLKLLALGGALLCGGLGCSVSTLSPGASAAGDDESPVQYDGQGRLRFPQDWRRWVLVGSSLGLGYSDRQGAAGQQAFHHVLMEPSAFRHYERTGEFAEKTMFALAIYSQGSRQSIARAGSYSKDLMAVEIALKDHERFEEGWAYFDFGTGRAVSRAFDKSGCWSCHNEHGQKDNVFLQFYPVLRGAEQRAE